MREKKRRRECVDWGLDTIKLCYYQLGIGCSHRLDRKTLTGGKKKGKSQLIKISLRKYAK